jgi:ribonuclease VapC
MAKAVPAYVLDSFALLAYFQAEPGGANVRDLLEKARDGEALLYLSIINAGETYYLMCREKGRTKAEALIQDLRELPITLLSATDERVWSAARWKAQYAISYADAFALDSAKEFGATLVTGDPEFKALESDIAILWLSQS